LGFSTLLLGGFEDGVDAGRDLAVALLCRVLVDEAGSGCGVAEAGHELPGGGAEGPGEMSEVVEVEIGVAGGVSGFPEPLPKDAGIVGGASQMRIVRCCRVTLL
jgi:hypothetical protein